MLCGDCESEAKRPSDAADCSLLVKKIEAMATIMADTAADMEYYGGFSKRIQQHAKDLRGAAQIAKTWARGIQVLAAVKGGSHEGRGC